MVKPIHIVIAVLILAGILIAFNWEKVKSWFSKPATAPEKTDAEKCTEANKSKPDGEACSNCVAEGSGAPSFNGVIKDGDCVPKQEPAPQPQLLKIKIKATGAIPYAYVGGRFIAPRSVNKIPAGTVLTVLQRTVSPAVYYNTAMGWISSGDADVVV